MNMISIIVSVFNEEAVLELFYQAFEEMRDRLTWDYELIFVDDGSKDRSYEILKELSLRDSRIKVIHFSRNFGHEAAMIAGIDYASGDGVLCMDADLQHPLEYIPQIIEKFEQGYEVINMVRTENRSVGFFKNLASRGFYKLINRPILPVTLEETVKNLSFFKSNLLIQTMFLKGEVDGVAFDNTSEENVSAWVDIIKKLKPKRVLIYSLDRETPATKLKQISKQELELIAERVRAYGIRADIY